MIFMPLPDDLGERERRFALLAAFMAWKLAHGFVGSSELQEPDAAVAYAVFRTERVAALRHIRRNPLQFGDIEWLGGEAISDEIARLLPGKETSIDQVTLQMVQAAFSEHGEMPAKRLS